ncbi:MAG TPA: ferrous iron transport protein B [Spirochaetota bacterium]|nr:ferrous iron transport protein B [Spirochaetota bacterium]HPI87870.1 ferrous iron transport protein B [Spirochaetota bacterium]HPR47398.1 ferrous iron transport protein B [Spirochaetota bacterium]
MTLDQLQNGNKGIIIKVRGRGAFRKRILEMGFIKGQHIEVIKNAPLKDPVEYKVMGYNVSLRRSEAGLIDVYPLEEDAFCEDVPAGSGLPRGHGHFRRRRFHHLLQEGTEHGVRQMFPHEIMERRRRYHRRNAAAPECVQGVTGEVVKAVAEQSRVIDVVLVGNPNSGKTTLFNYVSGSRERVGNYTGVTVEAKEARFRHGGYIINVIDLPGTYSITEYSREEIFVRDYIINNSPDVVVNIVDASNLERNLYLTTQLIDMDVKAIIALNMYDELNEAGHTFDYQTLGRMVGCPFVPTVASRGEGLDELFDRVIDVFEDREDTIRHIHINYGNDLERSIAAIQDRIRIDENCSLTDRISSRFMAIKLLEKDKKTEELVFNSCANRMEVIKEARTQIERLEAALKEDTETLITDAKYGFIAGALRETFKPGQLPDLSPSERIDRLLTHTVLGIPIFLFFMWLTFTMTFVVGEYPMQWIDSFMHHFSLFVTMKMPDGILKNLIVDGILAGVGGVIIFLPNILILFFMISFMEDTGYMARAAFIMDRAMHKIGLHGKSFIPLIMGFGCNVPAIMATRTLESRKDRLLTMVIIPFMSCSARLPVYVLFISAFFPAYPGSMLFMVYMIGVFIAIAVGVTLKKTIFRAEEVPFVMELPPYRMPHLKTTLRHMWDKGVEYLKKIGGVILVASIIIWVLGNFPMQVRYSRDYDAEMRTIQENYEATRDSVARDSLSAGVSRTLDSMKEEMEKEIEHISYAKESERLSHSYIGVLGRAVEPLLSPLGFDWKMSISIITGLAAKEVVVGTLGVLYHADPEGREGVTSLVQRLRTVTHTEGQLKGQKVFTPLKAFSFILFVLIYFPCAAVIATIRRESGSWRWALFTAFHNTMLAWIVTFIVYRAGMFIMG